MRADFDRQGGVVVDKWEFLEIEIQEAFEYAMWQFNQAFDPLHW